MDNVRWLNKRLHAGTLKMGTVVWRVTHTSCIIGPRGPVVCDDEKEEREVYNEIYSYKL